MSVIEICNNRLDNGQDMADRMILSYRRILPWNKHTEMAKKIKKIVKKGRWVYGNTVPSEVWIIKQNYFEGPTSPDEDRTPGYPPRDEKGMFYYASYVLTGATRSISIVCGSVDEAVLLAERTIQGEITWESEQ
jgi:hypothetical protein